MNICIKMSTDIIFHILGKDTHLKNQIIKQIIISFVKKLYQE